MNIIKFRTRIINWVRSGFEQKKQVPTRVRIKRDHMESEKHFAQLIAKMVTGDYSPRFVSNKDCANVQASLCEGVDRLVFGEKENAIGFFCGAYGMALVRIESKTYIFLKSAHKAINTKEKSLYIGEFQLKITPLKTWFGIAT